MQTQLNITISFACERGVLGPLSTLQYGRSYEDSSLLCNLFNIVKISLFSLHKIVVLMGYTMQ